MEIWQAIVLGFVQGLTEFFPVSSSGHFALTQKLLGITSSGLFFDVMLHVATLIPLITVFFDRILNVFKRPFNKLKLVLIATLPTVVLGLLLESLVEQAFNSIIFLIIGFLLTAINLIVCQKVTKKRSQTKTLNTKTAFIIGLMQGVAVFPAISRSGLTITTGEYLGINKKENAEFSFLISIPVILGGAFISFIGILKTGVESIEILPLVFGMFSACISGYLAINLMVKVIEKTNYKWFSIYLIILSFILTILKLCVI